MSRPQRTLKTKRCPCDCANMPRPKRSQKRVCYTEVSASSVTLPNPQVYGTRPSRPVRVPEPSAEPAPSSSSGVPPLMPIWPPTLPSPATSESPPPPPYDYEQQYTLEGNYLASLLTCKFFCFFLFCLCFFYK